MGIKKGFDRYLFRLNIHWRVIKNQIERKKIVQFFHLPQLMKVCSNQRKYEFEVLKSFIIEAQFIIGMIHWYKCSVLFKLKIIWKIKQLGLFNPSVKWTTGFNFLCENGASKTLIQNSFSKFMFFLVKAPLVITS